MQFTIENLQKYVDKGMLMRNKHPDFDYYIYNYTPEVQFKKLWNPTLMACRGLIMDGDSNIIARPFTKFFNYSELGPSARGTLNKRVAQVYDKMDGSLGILYIHPDGKNYSIASRGSFTSEQALFATSLLETKYCNWKDHIGLPAAGVTLIFEIIYPKNRIVINYGDMEDIVYLGCKDNKTGEDLLLWNDTDEWDSWPIVKRFPELEKLTMEELAEKVENHEGYEGNREGYVVKFANGSRAKLKYPEYIRLHRIMTDMTEKRVLEAVREGPLPKEMLDNIPDECYDWLKDTETRFRDKYEEIKNKAVTEFYFISETAKYADPAFTRKDWALEFLKTDHPSVLFNMLDDKPYEKLIWDKIQPKPGKQTFQTSGFSIREKSA
ncbi:hypothetical protein KAR91_79555 [Candidatus Pacearchaeota archaeon]|nr:hypothetical protein [Candidatus Pacearchaeota archaeon]